MEITPACAPPAPWEREGAPWEREGAPWDGAAVVGIVPQEDTRRTSKANEALFSPLDGILCIRLVPLGRPDLPSTGRRGKHGRVHRQLSRHRQPNLEPLVLEDAPVGIQLVGLIDEVEDIIRLA